MSRAQIAIVGCGYVASSYVRTLRMHPELELLGVVDIDRERSRRFAAHHRTTNYSLLSELLNDPRLQIVVNLTNPRAHSEVTREALEAGKHVYSEKPLAMRFEEARELVLLAESRGLELSCAPCSLLGESAQAAWRALRQDQIGRVRLVYAELDDGMVHRAPYKGWLSEAGAPWPYKDEFEVGCTLEHAGYYLTWLAAFFGPAESLTAFGSCTIPDKGTDHPLQVITPDFTVACIKFRSGVVARLTCSVVAPHDHSLRIVGDRGVLSVADCWDYRSTVRVQKLITVRRRSLLSPWKRRVRLPHPPVRGLRRSGASRMDFSRGVAELADAVTNGRRSRLSAEFCLHVNEIALAIHESRESSCTYQLRSTFDGIEPMPWAM